MTQLVILLKEGNSIHSSLVLGVCKTNYGDGNINTDGDEVDDDDDDDENDIQDH